MYVFSFTLGTCVFYIVMIIMLWGVIRKQSYLVVSVSKKKKKKRKRKGNFFLHVKKGWGVLLFG